MEQIPIFENTEQLFDNENQNRLYVQLRNPITATAISDQQRLLHHWNFQGEDTAISVAPGNLFAIGQVA